MGKKLASKGRIELERVTFGYHEDRPVFSDFSLIIEEGQRVALIGDSGNGKSTILHLIMKLYRPQQETVRIDGLDRRFSVLFASHSDGYCTPGLASFQHEHQG